MKKIEFTKIMNTEKNVAESIGINVFSGADVNKLGILGAFAGAVLGFAVTAGFVKFSDSMYRSGAQDLYKSIDSAMDKCGGWNNEE